MANQLLRYSVVRKADSLDDQKTAAQIASAETTSITQEELQEFVLSQIKRIIFGDDAGDWNTDFEAQSIQSLKELTFINNLTPAQHQQLRQLIHFIENGPAKGFASGAFKQVLPTGNPFPTSIIWWTSAATTDKIVEKLITRNAQQFPIFITWNMYALDGVTIIESITDAITYSGPFEVSRTRTIV